MSKYLTNIVKNKKRQTIVLMIIEKNDRMNMNNKMGDFMRMNKKTIISICLCVAVFFMAVGYAWLTTELRITGGANITSNWDVRIILIYSGNSYGSAYDLEAPSFTNNTAKFKCVLVNPGDAITYYVRVYNKGSITTMLDSLEITESGSDAIEYEVGISEEFTIEAGEYIDFPITARYKNDTVADPDESIRTLKLGLNWVQYINE